MRSLLSSHIAACIYPITSFPIWQGRVLPYCNEGKEEEMEKVKKLRLSRNLSQERIAGWLNMSVSTYSKKENGRLKWSLEEAKKLAEYFGMTIEEIFF